MIQVPEEVKALCMQDSINKNFRVSFPNGEYRDLVNADIVAESVVFTESIGSTTGLQFGLCEGSTLEFQTYYNYNIRNLKIKAGIEIDVSSLSGTRTVTDSMTVEVARRDDGLQPYEAPYTGIYTFYSADGAISNTQYVDVSLEEGEFITIYIPSEESGGAARGTYTVDISIITDALPEYAQTSEDVPFPFYYIPYGIFYVDSCKRDGQDNIRKIVAYQNKWDLDDSPMFELSEVEKRKMMARVPITGQQGTISNDYTPDVIKFICSCLNSSALLAENTLTPTTLSSYINMESVTYKNCRGSYWANSRMEKETFTMEGIKVTVKGSPTTALLKLYTLQYVNTVNQEALADKIINRLSSAILPHDRVMDRAKIYKYICAPRFKFDLFTTYISDFEGDESGYWTYEDPTDTSSSFIVSPNHNYSCSGIPEYINNREVVIYAYYSDLYAAESRTSGYITSSYCPDFEVFIPTSLVHYTSYDSGAEVSTIDVDFTIGLDDEDVYTINNSSSFNLLEYDEATANLLFARQEDSGRYLELNLDSQTWQEVYNVVPQPHTVGSCSYIANDYSKFVNTREIANAMAELAGAFLKLDRESNFEAINLYGKRGLYPRSDLYPLDRTLGPNALYPQGPDHLVTRSLWRSVWYEDKASNPYDKVCCTWKNSQNQDYYIEYVLVDTSEDSMLARNYQHYDISNNYFIKTSGLMTLEQVTAVVQNLATILKNVQYYVADIDMRGLPYMEAGDSVTVLTQSSGFDTFALRHRISGIHALMDSIEAR